MEHISRLGFIGINSSVSSWLCKRTLVPAAVALVIVSVARYIVNTPVSKPPSLFEQRVQVCLLRNLLGLPSSLRAGLRDTRHSFPRSVTLCWCAPGIEGIKADHEFRNQLPYPTRFACSQEEFQLGLLDVFSLMFSCFQQYPTAWIKSGQIIIIRWNVEKKEYRSILDDKFFYTFNTRFKESKFLIKNLLNGNKVNPVARRFWAWLIFFKINIHGEK